MFKNNSSSLVEKVAQDLFDMIFEEEVYEVGDQLPNEIKLAEMFDVSRGTMREALNILRVKGIIKVHRGKGTFVQNIESLVKNEDFFSLIDDNIDLKEMLEVRFILEAQIAYLAAIRASDDEIKEIEETCKIVNKRIELGEDRTKEELAFHNAIVNATHNDFLKKLLPIINMGIGSAVLNAKNNDEIAQATISDHNRICKYIKNKNPINAELAMKSHILSIAELLGIDILNP